MTPAARDPLADVAAEIRVRIAERSRTTWPSDRYRNDPVGFARDILDVSPWDAQQRVLEALVPEDAAVSAVSGHKTGKTITLGCASLWFWGTRRRARVVLFGPKIEQLEVGVWPEIVRLYKNSGRCKACRAREHAKCAHEVGSWECKPVPPCAHCSPLGPTDWINDRSPVNGLHADDGREVFAYGAKNVDAQGGISGPEVLQLFDEAGGVKQVFFDSQKGNEAGGVRKCLMGNPLHTAGELYYSHHEGKPFYTATFQISSRDTPNVKAGKKLIPGLATGPWCAKREAEWGRDSLLTRTRVDGKFPVYTPGQLVRLDQLAAATERWSRTSDEGRLQIGVDVAFSGDDAAWAPRRGQKILELTAETGFDPQCMELARRVAECARQHRRPHERPPLIVFDSNGKAGQAFAQAIREYEDEFDIVAVNGTHTPRLPRQFKQLRDEVAYHFAGWVKNGGALPADAKLEGEIAATKGEAVSKTDRRARVISNDELKAILGRSPDRRNACELAAWPVTAEDRAAAKLLSASPAPAGPRVAPDGGPAPAEIELLDGPDPWSGADAGMRAAWGGADAGIRAGWGDE